MEQKVRLGVSSCLLGHKVRYDGGHKLDRYLTNTLSEYVEFVPVCPEVECGFPVPRESLRLVGDPESPRLVTTRTGQDFTDRMSRWAGRRVVELEKEGLCGYIFKSKSPSCPSKRTAGFTIPGFVRTSSSGSSCSSDGVKCSPGEADGGHRPVHYVRKYDQPYLKQQVYLAPHPVELKLRNHA